jgi:hypothetical protein
MTVLFIHRHAPLPFSPPAFTPPSPTTLSATKENCGLEETALQEKQSQKKHSHLQQRANPGLPFGIVIKKETFKNKQRFSKNNKETCPLFEDLPEIIFCFGPILCTTKTQSRAAFFLVLPTKNYK